MRIALVLFLIIFSGCNANNESKNLAGIRESSADSSKILDSLSGVKSDKFGMEFINTTTLDYCTSCGNLRSLRQLTLKGLIENIKKEEEGVEEATFIKGTITLTLIQNGSINYFQNAGASSTCWVYYYFHDIYTSFFSYPEVEAVRVMNGGRNYTYLPVIGDVDGVIPEGLKMKREWYCMNVNYWDYLDIEDSSNYVDFSKGIVKKEKLDSLFSCFSE